MLRTTLIAAALLTSTGAPAAADLDRCEKWQEVATAIMENRQAGIPLQFQIQLAEEEDESGLAAALVEAAYKVPRYESQATRDYAAHKFGQEVLIVCAMGDDGGPDADSR